MLKLFLLTLGIVFVSVLLLGHRLFFTKTGKFPNSHVEGNKEMRKRGITCINSQDRVEQKRKKITELNQP